MSLTVVLLLLLLLLILMVGKSAAVDDHYTDERSDLVLLRDSLSSTIELHSNWTGPPCHKDNSRWLGIRCSNSNVVGIALEGIQLTGSLPRRALQNVTYLTNLSFSNNALHGSLPTLRGLLHLRFVSFSGNRFSGAIPREFTNLPSLSRLELQDNLLNGTIPPFNQKNLTLVNVSYNFLEGRIPATRVLQKLPSSLFDHNLKLCGKPLDNSCSTKGPTARPSSPATQTQTQDRHSGSKSSITESPSLVAVRPWVLALIAVGAALVSFILTLCFLYCFKRYCNKASKEAQNSVALVEVTEKGNRSSESISDGSKNNVELEFIDKQKASFNLDDLLTSSAEMIGKGNLGNTYKVTLESGATVIVKRLKYTSKVSKKEFVQQMQLLGKLKHENLVEIVSFYYSKEEKLSVYENVRLGSLYHLLHENRGEGRVPLKWGPRLQIVKGIARGLAHLHQCLQGQKVPHANLKSSNVLIHPAAQKNSFYQAKLTDFGFLPLISSNYINKLAIGKAPEASQAKRLTHKCDVYCLGLVLLEIITGHAQGGEREEDLPGWVRLVINNNWSTDILDLEIMSEKESHEDMLKLTEIALQCTASEPEERPTVVEVARRIEEIRERKDTGKSLL